MGEQLYGLSIKDLNSLESQLEFSLLDDGSPTSTNLGNDHGFISEEC